MNWSRLASWGWNAWLAGMMSLWGWAVWHDWSSQHYMAVAVGGSLVASNRFDRWRAKHRSPALDPSHLTSR